MKLQITTPFYWLMQIVSGTLARDASVSQIGPPLRRSLLRIWISDSSGEAIQLD
jgi:hypothetical protein